MDDRFKKNSIVDIVKDIDIPDWYKATIVFAEKWALLNRSSRNTILWLMLHIGSDGKTHEWVGTVKELAAVCGHTDTDGKDASNYRHYTIKVLERLGIIRRERLGKSRMSPTRFTLSDDWKETVLSLERGEDWKLYANGNKRNHGNDGKERDCGAMDEQCLSSALRCDKCPI